MKMLRSVNYILIVFSVVLLCGVDAVACLTFCLKYDKGVIYGRNFDWNSGVGALVVNPRGIKKRAFVRPPDRPLAWVSQYGSVTFNPLGRELPVGGMNEKGLVIESMVCEAEYPPRDGRKSINELQWIQYHLDSCSNVVDAVASAKRTRISPYAVKLHYLMSDSSGDIASIEFIDGKVVVRSGDSLAVKVLANTQYDKSLSEMTGRARGGSPSSTRFARSARMLERYDGSVPPDTYAFSVLDAVSQRNFTQWQVVYDVSSRKISFRSSMGGAKKTLNFADLDFGRGRQALILNLSTKVEGAVVSLLEECTQQRNDALMAECYRSYQKEGLGHLLPARDIADIRAAVAACKAE